MVGEIEWQLHQRLLVVLQCAAGRELLAGAQQPLTPDATEQQGEQIALAQQGLLHQGRGVDAVAHRAVAAPAQLQLTGQAVVHPGHHIAEVHQLQQVASLPWLAHVANRAVLAIVLPRALQIIEGFPAAQPFGALIKLQQQLAAFTTQL